jgi:hypothetical protein
MDLSILQAMIDQICKQPAMLMLVVFLSVIAYVLEIWPRFDSRWIPIVCILGGGGLYWLFASSDSVPKFYPYPIVILITNGLIAGLFSSAAHSTIVSWLMKKAGQKDTPPDK